MKTFKHLLSLCLVFCLLAAPALAQQAAPQKAPETAAVTKPRNVAELQARITALLDVPKFAAARWGILVKLQGAGQDKIVFERDADKSFMPASNMKLYTTATALDAFGPEFKIKTSVYTTKPVSKGGTLRGDLILYGRGDPNLSPRFDENYPQRYDDLKSVDRITPIEQLADRIKAAGIRIISGKLIGDDSYFAGDLIGPGWEWDDLQFYYGAEVSALTVNDNCVSFTVTPGKAGDKPTITVQPQTAYVKIINNAKTSENGRTRIGINRPLDSNTVEFFGTIPRTVEKYQVNVAIHDPASYAATLLKEALARRGIRLLGNVERMDSTARIAKPFDESKLTEIATVESAPMSELIKVVNKPSQNLHAELLLRQLGATGGPHEPQELDDYGRPRTTIARGNEARRQFLQKAGVEVVPLSLRDGSGLARQDLVTPRATVRLLEFMLTHTHANVFRESLPIAGVDGTLERRMRDTAAANNFRGKTGTLTGVNALSGYVATKRGQVLIVSLMGNNYAGAGREVTGVFDQIAVLLAEYEGEL